MRQRVPKGLGNSNEAGTRALLPSGGRRGSQMPCAGNGEETALLGARVRWGWSWVLHSERIWGAPLSAQAAVTKQHRWQLK